MDDVMTTAATGTAAGTAPTTATVPILPSLDGILLLEQPFARAPYDELKRQLRTQQRLFEREFQYCNSALSALGAPAATPTLAVADDAEFGEAAPVKGRATSGSMEAVVAATGIKKSASPSKPKDLSIKKKKKRLSARASTSAATPASELIAAASERLGQQQADLSAISGDEDVSMSIDAGGETSADMSLLEPPPPPTTSAPGGGAASSGASSFAIDTPAGEGQHSAPASQGQRLMHRSSLLDNANASASGDRSKAEAADLAAAAQGINTMLTRLRGLKRKLSPLAQQMQVSTRMTQARVDHLSQLHAISDASKPEYAAWTGVRLDRMLNDYILRKGYSKTAEALSQKRGIEDLVDNAIFAEIEKIERTLVPDTKDVKPCCQAALAWCTENKASLRKIKSSLEFDLRLQEFIELARVRTPESLQEAILHARRHLMPYCTDTPPPSTETEKHEPGAWFDFATAHLLKSKVYRAMGLLACKAGGWTYEDLYNEGRWLTLRETFRACALEIHSLPPQPVIHIALSAGLSTLKLQSCYSHEKKSGAAEQQNGHGAATHGKVADARAPAGTPSAALPRFPPAAGLVDEMPPAVPTSEVAGSAQAADSTGAPAESSVSGVTAIGISAAAQAASTGARPLAAAAVGAEAVSSSPTAAGREDRAAATSASEINPEKRAADGRNQDCPVCDTDGLGMLAREVPWSHHMNSTLICRITGKVMNEDDPPMVLPNGRVYSTSALTQLAIKSGDGTVTCPATGTTFSFSAATKMYIS